ncbi:MAG: transposase, partial [Acidobacteria bacterium]|nr:transposase [Acidobacteriota bacterium]
EGTHSTWLSALLKPLVKEVVVCDARHTKLLGTGNKSDQIDAEKLAELLRLGALKAVYKGNAEQQQLKDLARAYDNLISDCTRVMNRIKAIYRGRGLKCDGHDIYKESQREEWLGKLTEEGARFRARSLFAQLEKLQELRSGAKQELLRESRRHPDYQLLLSQPGLGPVRVAILLANVGSPHRFRTKRQFWPYCGLAVVTYSSADHQVVNGVITKRRKILGTRGLNPHHVPALKSVFKDAALSAKQREPFKSWYQERIDKGQRPEMVRLSLARKLAATTLVCWQRREKFDLNKVSATRLGE